MPCGPPYMAGGLSLASWGTISNLYGQKASKYSTERHPTEQNLQTTPYAATTKGFCSVSVFKHHSFGHANNFYRQNTLLCFTAGSSGDRSCQD